jgi:hypothetical protein
VVNAKRRSSMLRLICHVWATSASDLMVRQVFVTTWYDLMSP